MKTTMLKNEFWYGGAVYEGYRQPVGADDIVDWDFRENPTHNQIMPLFLSSKGRYIWSNAGFHISFQKGEILAEADFSKHRYIIPGLNLPIIRPRRIS